MILVLTLMTVVLVGAQPVSSHGRRTVNSGRHPHSRAQQRRQQQQHRQQQQQHEEELMDFPEVSWSGTVARGQCMELQVLITARARQQLRFV